MHERVQYGEVGRQEFGHEAVRRRMREPGRWTERWVRAAGGRRPASGPRPVRPAGVLVMVRPLEVPRPVRDAVGPRAGGGSGGVAPAGSGQRLLVRAGVGVGVRSRSRARRVLAGAALVAASAAAVVILGLLARPAEPTATPVRPPAPVVVTVEAGETVWEVAARVAPGRPGAEVAAVAERIVADNALRSVRLEPGQVLRVAGG